jgi:hypothetical protein
MNDALAWPGEPETAAAPGQAEETRWPGSPEQEQKRANPVDLFSYHVATNGIGAVQGLLRGLQGIASDSAKEKVLQDSIDGLQKYKAETLPQYYGVTSEDLKSTASKVAAAGAAVSDIAAGPAVMISKMAGQTYGDTYAAAEQQIRAGGETDEGTIRNKAREQARNSIFKLAPTLLAYGLGGQVAAKGAELILPEAAGPLARLAVGTGTSAAANLAVSGTTRAIEGQPVTGDLQENLTDIFFGAAGGVHAALHTWPGKAEQPVAERVLTPDEVKVIQPETTVPTLPDRAPITASPDVERAAAPIPAEIAQTQSAIAAREEMLASSVDAAERQTIANEIVDLRGQLAGQQRAHDEAAAFENAWAIIPPATRQRMALDLRSRGIPEERIAAMTPEEARAEITRPIAADTAATTEAPGSATEPRQLSEEEMARRDWESEMLQQMDEAQAGQGRDLLDAIVRSGGLPSKESPARQLYAGELADIESAVRDPNRKAGSAASPIDLFRKDAPGLDTLATNLRDHGFDVQTPDDLLQLLDQRIRKGRPIYGTPELASVFEGAKEFGLAPNKIANYVRGNGSADPEKAAGAIAQIFADSRNRSDGRYTQPELFEKARRPDAAAVPAAISENVRKALRLTESASVREEFSKSNVISSILPKLISRAIPGFDIAGKVITSPRDFALLTAALRTPYFESLKVAFLDKDFKVVHSQSLVAAARSGSGSWWRRKRSTRRRGWWRTSCAIITGSSRTRSSRRTTRSARRARTSIARRSRDRGNMIRTSRCRAITRSSTDSESGGAGCRRNDRQLKAQIDKMFSRSGRRSAPGEAGRAAIADQDYFPAHLGGSGAAQRVFARS